MRRRVRSKSRPSLLPLLALLLALSLIAAACDGGGEDGGGEAAGEGEQLEEGEVAEADVAEEEVDQDAFYYNKELEIIVPFSTGGGTDTQARLMAPFLAEHVPGNPNVGVFNIAGAGGTIGNNQFANERDPEEATSVLFSSASSFFPWIFGDPALDLDYTTLVPVMAAQTGGVVYVHENTGITGPDDFMERAQEVQWVAGEQTPDSLGLLFILAYDMLELDHNVVMGYEGRGPARVSFEQAELNINWDTTASYNSSVQELVDAGTAIPVFTAGQMQEGELVRDPAFPDLPHFGEVYESIIGEAPSGQIWDAYQALTLSGFTVQKAMWLHEGAPEQAVEELRQGFANMAEDPEFQEQGAELMELDSYDLFTGDEAEEVAGELLDFPEETRGFLIDYIVENYDYQDPRTQG